MNLTILPIRSILSNKISFNGYNIIDGHTHIGQQNDKKYTVDDLLGLTKVYNPYDWKSDDISNFVVSGIEAMSKSNGKYILDEIEGNKKTLLSIKNSTCPDKFIPLAVCQVDSGSSDNIDKLLSDKKDKFYGLKFHPMAIQIDADDKRYESYMKVAQKHNVPCVFHTENGYGDPKKIYNLAKKFPEVPVVLYHMNIVPSGRVGDLQKEEIERKQLEKDKDKWCWDVREKWNREGINVVEQALKNGDADLYLELSWTKPESMVEAVKRVGADRVIWGTDAPIGDFGENSNRERYIDNVNNFKQAIRKAFPNNAEEIEDKIFYKNAERLFKKGKFQNNNFRYAQQYIANVNATAKPLELSNNNAKTLNLTV